jgi:hypothetical protein
MPFLLFLRGLVGVLIVFAVANYVITQSLWTTLVNTVICAVLIQIGYFIAVLFLVWRAGASEKQAENAARTERATAEPKESRPEAAPLPGIRRSPLP